jgi:uncharacterized protein YdaU (DUF1376 family)
MHYFKFHISDYYANTSHLSDDADLCYRRLLDYYYLNDGLLPDLKMLAKKIKFAKKEDIVLEILDEFFTLENGIYTHQRADKELFEYKEKANTNKRIAQEREEKKRKNKEQTGEQVVHDSCTVGEQVVHDSPPNHKPLTINQEPLTNNQEPILKTTPAQSQAIDAPPQKKRNTIDWDWTDRIVERFGVSEQVAQDLIIARKAKRAVITETVLNNFQKEVKKVNDAGVYLAEREAFAYWVASGWQAFKANWYLKGQQPAGGGFKQKETIEECMARLPMDVTPQKNGLGFPVFDDFDSDNPFAYNQKNSA